MKITKQNIKWWILGELMLAIPAAYFVWRWLDTQYITKGQAAIIGLTCLVLAICGLKLASEGYKELKSKGGDK